MPGKKFISKKNAVTYRLVPRCQLDPDGDSSEHILVPVDEAKHNKFDVKLPECVLPPVREPPKSKKQIPEMGSQHNWDPDILAALDDGDFDDDDDDVLDDNFVAIANRCVGKTKAFNEFENGSENGDDESLFSDEDEWFSGSVASEEKPKHTQYSLTNCNEDIQILNERFERLCETYDDDQIGALDFEEIDGYNDPLKDTVEGREAHFEDYKRKLDPYENGLDEHLKEKTLFYAGTSGEDEESDMEEEVTEKDPIYDCESIISTYSNKHNHPMLIKVEKKEKPVSKISTNLWKQSLTKSNLRKVGREADEEEDMESTISDETIMNTFFRPKNETPEEKRQRKQAVKEMQRENRIFKKENKLAFKEEKKKRTSVMLNANRNRGVRLPC